mmetsp:Transcript_40674/g.130973  ORF Transcript_40674/g.130973 Transcript_40674/m.130973 type:complete len:212 (+) Transcript_40674:1368-2003(+)
MARARWRANSEIDSSSLDRSPMPKSRSAASVAPSPNTGTPASSSVARYSEGLASAHASPQGARAEARRKCREISSKMGRNIASASATAGAGATSRCCWRQRCSMTTERTVGSVSLMSSANRPKERPKTGEGEVGMCSRVPATTVKSWAVSDRGPASASSSAPNSEASSNSSKCLTKLRMSSGVSGRPRSATIMHFANAAIICTKCVLSMPR